jgi:hypothetical protein
MDPNKVQYMTSIIDQAYVIAKETYWYWYSNSQEKNKLKNMMEFFITKFYMLNPNENYLKKFLNPKNNHIIQDISRTFYIVFERIYPKQNKQQIKDIIIQYATDSVQYFIKLIDEAPEKLDVNEKSIAGIRKKCIDVLEFDDEAKLHEVLKDLDNVVFLIPTEYMRAGTPNAVDYKYLAFTYPKNFIKSWFNESSKKIKYCDTDEDNKSFKQKTPYVLSPLNFNCDNAYVNVWQLLHIIHSTQRIFYVLPSPSEGPKHKCMKQQESQEIVKIAICNSNKKGNNCWKWDENTECITASDQEKVNIQIECNMNAYEEYMRKQESLKLLKTRTKRIKDVQKKSESIESLRERERKYIKKII